MGRMKPRKQFEAMGTISLWVQNLKQALRNLRSHGWQAGISATGLAVGIVCLTFSVNWLWTETNYDYFRPDYKDLYLVQHDDTASLSYSNTYTWPYVVLPVAMQLDSLLEGKAEVGLAGMTVNAQILSRRAGRSVFLCQRFVFVSRDGECLGVYGAVRRP